MTLTFATSPADSAAADSIVRHHEALLEEARALTEALLGDPQRPTPLAEWYERELLPHAIAEEQVLYAAARSHAPLLVESMTMEHATLRALVQELSSTTDRTRIAGAARALLALLESHIAKENELVVPLLARATDLHLGELLADMQAKLGAAPEHTVAAHDCTCDEAPDDMPVLDARAVPHAIRHATVFGALEAVRPGGGIVLVAPHDPLPLLAQLEKRSPATFDVTYRQRGPEAWRLAITRR